jgi:hypothetical protein
VIAGICRLVLAGVIRFDSSLDSQGLVPFFGVIWTIFTIQAASLFDLSESVSDRREQIYLFKAKTGVLSLNGKLCLSGGPGDRFFRAALVVNSVFSIHSNRSLVKILQPLDLRGVDLGLISDTRRSYLFRLIPEQIVICDVIDFFFITPRKVLVPLDL